MMDLSERAQARVFVAPAVTLLILVAGYPLITALWLSLQRFILVFQERSFIGVANYTFLFGDLRFWAALGNTAYFTALAVALEFALALPVALMLDAAVRGRGLLRAAVLIPWAIPTAIAARTWAWLLHPDYGVLTQFFNIKHINWLGTPGLAMHAAIFVDVWKTTPFVALLILAGLQGISADLLRAARVDGASAWRTFLLITLPLLRPALAVALLFRTLDAFRVFDAIYVLTEGGPANSTETLSIYAYKTLMRSGDFGYGSTLASMTFVCVLLLSLALLAIFRRSTQGDT